MRRERTTKKKEAGVTMKMNGYHRSYPFNWHLTTICCQLKKKILLYHWTLKKSLSCQPHHSKASAKTSPAQNSGNGYFHTQRALTCQTHFLPNTFIKFHHQAHWLHTMKLQGNRKYCFLGSLGFNCTDKRNIFEMYNSLLKQGEYWEWKWALIVDYARITGANQNYPRDCRTYGH